MQGESTTRPVRVILIESDERICEQLKVQLQSNGLKVIGDSDNPESGLRLIRGLEPDLVFMELPPQAADTLAVIERLRHEMPRVVIIATAHEPSAQTILSTMRAGAREFLMRPIDNGELQKILQNLRNPVGQEDLVARSRGSMFSVFSAKGGAGSTTLACSLAVALCEDHDSRVALVDLNLQMGEVLVHMDLPKRYSLVDAFRNGTLDQESLRNVMTQHSSGVYVAVGATGPEEGEELKKHWLVELSGVLNTMFDHVVVDLGSYVDDRTVEVLDLSDSVLMVTQLHLPAIRNTAQYLDLFNRLDIDTRKIELVVNRYNKKYPFTLDDLKDTVQRSAYWTIPNDYASVTSAANSGIPVVTKRPRSGISKSIKKLATELRKREPLRVVPEEVPVGVGQ